MSMTDEPAGGGHGPADGGADGGAEGGHDGGANAAGQTAEPTAAPTAGRRRSRPRRTRRRRRRLGRRWCRRRRGWRCRRWRGRRRRQRCRRLGDRLDDGHGRPPTTVRHLALRCLSVRSRRRVRFATTGTGSRSSSRAADLPSGFADLFSVGGRRRAAVSRRGLRTPFLRVAKDGAVLPDSAVHRAGGGPARRSPTRSSDDKLLRLFADGATLVLQGLHRTWASRSLDLHARHLAADLGHPVQVNAYVTPPQNQGFSDHYDVHDVFVLQVAGEKRWQIRRARPRPSPLRDQPWTDRRAAVRTGRRASR